MNLTASKRPQYCAALIIIIAAAACIWLPKLGRDLWIDETITFWVSKDGIRDALRRAYEYQSNGSLYFIFTWAYQHLVGPSPVALRAINIPLGIATCLLFFALAKHLFSFSTALLALSFFASSSFLINAIIDYRPYALLLFFLVLSLYCIGTSDTVELSKRRVSLAGFSFGIAISLNVLYAASGLLIFGLLIVRAIRFPGKSIIPTVIRFSLIALIPLATTLPNFLANISRKQLITLSNSLPFIDYVEELFISQRCLFIILPILIILFSLSMVRGQSRLQAAGRKDAIEISILIMLCLFVPCSMYFYDRGLSVYSDVSHYWFWAAIPECLLLGKISSHIVRGKEIVLVTLAALLVNNYVPGDMQYQQAAEIIDRQVAENPKCAVIIQSGVVESRDPAYFSTPESLAFLATPLSVYPINPPYTVVSLTNKPTLPSHACNLVLGYPYRMAPSDSSEKVTSSVGMILRTLGQKCEQLSSLGVIELYKCHA